MTQSRRTNESRSMAINFIIRTLACSDAQRVMELNAQLGYDADVRHIRVRLDRLGREPAHHLIGVEGPGGLVAFAHFFERPSSSGQTVAQCPLLAQSRHETLRTSMSAFDPERTFRLEAMQKAEACISHASLVLRSEKFD